MSDLALELLQKHIDDDHLGLFAQRLAEWLVADLNQSEEDVPAFTESRAKALLRATGVIDEPTLHDFNRLMETDTAVRVALYDLMSYSGVGENEQIPALAATSGATEIANLQSPISIPWLSLSIAAHAWKSEYPLYQLDPASPPGEYSPAGQLVKRAATFMRQQIQRGATERDKLGRKLAFGPETAVPGTPTLDQLSEQQPIAPVPPHFRPPVPVNYPEVARETLQVESDEAAPQTSVTRNPSITITDHDLPADEQRPITMPPIRITPDQVPPETRRPTPSRPPSSSGTTLATAVRQRFIRDREPLKSTKLRIVVQELQDGPGLYGVQVRVGCQGIKAQVAGTTNRDGIFLCELPVRVRSGLTYDVDITWPRELGGDIERKSITLNADRTEFRLPFYRRLNA